MVNTSEKIQIICEVYGTSIDRIRKLRHCVGNDLKALKDIASYLRNTEYWTLSDIGDLLYRDESTVRRYLRFDSTPSPVNNGLVPV